MKARRSSAPGLLLLGAVLIVPVIGGTHAAEQPKAAAEPTLRTWYAQALARGSAGVNVTHFWSKGPKLRAETVIAGSVRSVSQ